MDNNKDLTKLKMLMNAINEVKEDEELDDEVDFYEELKEAAWNILHENPGTDFGDWQDMLIEQYPTEVVDALGSVLHVSGLGRILRHGAVGGTLRPAC